MPKEIMFMNGEKVPLGGAGAILTRTAIIEAIEVNTKIGEVPEITISPYDRSCIGPCSYDIHTGTQYATYKDMKKKKLVGTHWEYQRNEDPDDPDAEEKTYSGHWVEVEDFEWEFKTIDPYNPSSYMSEIQDIPETGLLCKPGEVYLIGTKETVGSDKYEPILTAKSSIGRLGISIAFASFGDIGFNGTWTLQIVVTYPTLIYPDMKIGQIYFLTPSRDVTKDDLYNGKYQGATGLRASEYYKDVD